MRSTRSDHRLVRHRTRARLLGSAAALLLLLDAVVASAADGDRISVADLRDLSLEELGTIKITSVSRQSEPLNDAPAAIYVITNEDIRRSGATSIPEILRLAPNLEVAQVSANSYAISARGFNGTAANKLQVLIDGRTIYTPLFSGVFWDVQDVVPDDIARIEVISGPGGTLWGANAVNGVINIITKHTRDTQGGLVTFGGGNTKIDGAVRYGGKIGETTYRLYAKDFQYDETTQNGTRLHNAWNKPQGGFRMDWNRGADALTIEGDIYRGSEDETLSSALNISGQDLLSRWTRNFDHGSTLQVQAYYDYANRSTSGDAVISEVSTYDLDVQHSFSPADRHAVVWGGGYRFSQDRVAISPNVFFVPASRNLSQADLFAQDSISLTDDLKLILGTRIENNNYTGLAPLPSARLAWKLSDSALLWTAVSRAVRTPSRVDHDLFQAVGNTTVVAGGPNFKDEKLTAYEIGYRQQFGSRASLSISTFYNVYDDLRSFELSPTSSGLPILISNKMEGDSYGVEIWGNYRVTDWWRLSAGFNALHEHLRFKPGSSDPLGLATAGDDPHHQVSARSSMNITDSVAFDFGVRQVGRLPNPSLPSYFSVDARVGWKMLENVELSLTATNLFDDRHQEFGALPLQFGAPPLLNIGRTVFAALRGTY